jgi:capsular polysaccharide transport system permease protein
MWVSVAVAHRRDARQAAGSALAVQQRVLFALLLRELSTRYGPYRLGYTWALLEPVLHLLALTGVFALLGRGSVAIPNLALFLLSGIVPWLLLNNIVQRALGVLSGNVGLFGYRYVRYLDPLIARVALEVWIATLATCVLLAIFTMLGLPVSIHDPLTLLGVWLLYTVFCFAVGVWVMLLASQFREVQKTLPVLMRLFYFVSGVFYSLQALPAEVRPWAAWNPVLQFIESLRRAIFWGFSAPEANPTYLLLLTGGLLYLGLAVYRRREARLLLEAERV